MGPTTNAPEAWDARLDVVERLSSAAASELATRWLARAVHDHLAELVTLAGFPTDAEELRHADVERVATVDALLEAKRAIVVESPDWASVTLGPRVRCARDALSLARRSLATLGGAPTPQQRARAIGILAVLTAVRVDQSIAARDTLPETAPRARAELERCVVDVESLLSTS